MLLTGKPGRATSRDMTSHHMTLDHVQFQAGRRDQAKATLDSFVKEKSRIYIEIEKLNQEKVEILKEVRNVSLLSFNYILFNYILSPFSG